MNRPEHDTLFSDRARDSLPQEQQRGESVFEFVDRLDVPRLARGRQVANHLWRATPSGLRQALWPRLRGRDDDNHYGALFELVLHGSLAATGWLHAPPEVCTRSSPDFFVGTASADLRFVEATVRSGTEITRASAFIKEAARYLPGIGVWILVTDFVPGRQTPSAKHFARRLSAEVDEARRGGPLEAGARIDESEYEDPVSGLRFRYTLIERRDSTSSGGDLLVGETGEAYWARGKHHLERTLARKRHQHRDHGGSPLFAVAWNDFAHDPSNEEVAAVCAERDVPLIFVREVYIGSLKNLRMTLFATEPFADTALAHSWIFDVVRVGPDGLIAGARTGVSASEGWERLC